MLPDVWYSLTSKNWFWALLPMRGTKKDGPTSSQGWDRSLSLDPSCTAIRIHHCSHLSLVWFPQGTALFSSTCWPFSVKAERDKCLKTKFLIDLKKKKSLGRRQNHGIPTEEAAMAQSLIIYSYTPENPQGRKIPRDTAAWKLLIRAYALLDTHTKIRLQILLLTELFIQNHWELKDGSDQPAANAGDSPSFCPFSGTTWGVRVGEGSKVCFRIQGYFTIFPTHAKQIVPSLSVKKLIYYPFLVKKWKAILC